MLSFSPKSKKTQLSNTAYLSNGLRFHVLKGRTIRQVMGEGGGGEGVRKIQKNKFMQGKLIAKDNRAKKEVKKKITAE